MYFQKFPLTFYSLDDRKSTQLIPNFLLRVKFTNEIITNFSALDEYDVKDGETPEILAHKIYNDSNMHWVILHLNEVLNPRFEWVLSQNQLSDYVESKYKKINGIHHYENLEGNIVNGVISITVDDTGGLESGDTIINLSGKGTGVIRGDLGSEGSNILVTDGGFQSGDIISKIYDYNVKTTIDTATPLNVVPITNFIFEERENEKRRRIKILKPQFIQTVQKEFENKIALTDV